MQYKCLCKHRCTLVKLNLHLTKIETRVFLCERESRKQNNTTDNIQAILMNSCFVFRACSKKWTVCEHLEWPPWPICSICQRWTLIHSNYRQWVCEKRLSQSIKKWVVWNNLKIEHTIICVKAKKSNQASSKSNSIQYSFVRSSIYV